MGLGGLNSLQGHSPYFRALLSVSISSFAIPSQLNRGARERQKRMEQFTRRPRRPLSSSRFSLRPLRYLGCPRWRIIFTTSQVELPSPTGILTRSRKSQCDSFCLTFGAFLLIRDSLVGRVAWPCCSARLPPVQCSQLVVGTDLMVLGYEHRRCLNVAYLEQESSCLTSGTHPSSTILSTILKMLLQSSIPE